MKFKILLNAITVKKFILTENISTLSAIAKAFDSLSKKYVYSFILHTIILLKIYINLLDS